jgi:predicted permease
LIRRSPAFAAVVIGTLALGIGANTAIFSVLNALLLRSLPVHEPERLVELTAIYRNGAKVPFSYPVFADLGKNQRAFSELIGWTGAQPRNLEIDGILSRSTVRGVSGNYYGSLAAAPLLGRLIDREDAARTPGAQVAVLGYEFWESTLGRRSDLIGKEIRIDGQPFTIIGISRKWFTGITPGTAPDITIPLTSGRFAQYATNRALLWIFLTGRLKDGVSAEQASGQLKTFWTEVLARNAPTAVPGQRLESWMSMALKVNPESTGVNRDLREHFGRPVRVLAGVAALILLVACVNLASLTLARAAVRAGEISVRMSLGATRVEIARQLLTESILLSGAGALLALVLAKWTGGLLVSLMSGGLGTPVILDVHPDWRVFAFATLAAIATAILIALGPAWQLSRQQPSALLAGSERTISIGAGKLGKGLIVTQIALSFVLFQGAGLLLRTLQNLRSVDPQYQRNGVLEVILQARPGATLSLASNLSQPKRAGAVSKDEVNSYRKQMVEAMAGLPGAMSAAYAGIEIPAGDRQWKDTVSESGTDAAGQAPQPANLVVVSPRFFHTLEIPMIAGRDFEWSDDESHPRVAIVDSNLARQLRSDGNVVGMRVRFGVQPNFQQMEIAGVAQRARLIDLRDPGAAVIYICSAQEPSDSGNLFIRAQNPAGLEKVVDRELQSRGQEYPVAFRTLAETSEQALAEDRATAMLSAVFAGLALLLAGIGLFGLMSYAVTRRTREMGIRLALGSQRADIFRLVLKESMLIIASGVAIGIPFALLAAQLIAHMLFGVSTADPATLAGAAAALVCVGGLGGYWPARRATRTNPMVALRWE